MKILLASPRGFCAGVNRALGMINNILKIYGSPVYVRNWIVHNEHVISYLVNRGVIFVENICDVPDGSVLIFSAHGVSKKIKDEAMSRNFTAVFDATCPLVLKVQMEIFRISKKGAELILIGNSGHPEVDGLIGNYINKKGGIYLISKLEDIESLKIKNPKNLYYATQTTLLINDTEKIIHELNARFPKIIGPYKSDICYATTNRQKAVMDLEKQVDMFLIVGSKKSSNSIHLFKLAKKTNKPSYLINSINDIKKSFFKCNIKNIALSSGASTPDFLVENIIVYLKKIGVKKVLELDRKEEDVFFELPKNLKL